jgi:hypothetical protein
MTRRIETERSWVGLAPWWTLAALATVGLAAVLAAM